MEEGSNMIETAKTDPSVADVAAVNQRMLQGETGFGRYNFYGDNKFVGFAPIDGNQEWSSAIETSQREFKSTLDRSIMLTVLVVILVVLATFPVAVKVGRSISGPIQSCVACLEKMADGDLHTPTPQVKSKDETFKLAMALETMLARLNDVVQDVTHHLGKMAQGDFRENITRTYWGDFVAMEQSIKAIHSSLRNTLSQISQSAGTVAGSAGKGFAVVADEVRNLASKSDEAAKATKDLIEGSITAVAEGGQVVARVTESLDKTNSISENVTIKVDAVVRAVESQTTAIAQVTEGIDQISSVIQSTSATSEQSAATAQELSDQSLLMNNLVSTFRLS